MAESQVKEPQLTEEDVKNIINLRFDSLDDFRVIRREVEEIAKITGFDENTVLIVIDRVLQSCYGQHNSEMA